MSRLRAWWARQDSTSRAGWIVVPLVALLLIAYALGLPDILPAPLR